MGPIEWVQCPLKGEAGGRCETGNRCGREEGDEDDTLLTLKM